MVRAISLALSLAISVPFISMMPDIGGISFISVFSRVDLPLPFSPISAAIVPEVISRFMSDTTALPP